MNRKVKNATPRVYMGIHFRSNLEVETYKALKEAGLEPEYEKHRFILQDTKHFKVYQYIPFWDRKAHKDTWGLFPYKTLSIKYTPDFVIKRDDTVFIIECKGYQNDRYNYQKRLFMTYLEKNIPDSVFMEIHNAKQLKQAIEIITTWQTEKASETSAG